MTIPKVGSAAGAGQSPAVDAGKEKFSKVLEGQKPGQRSGGTAPVPSEVAPRQVVDPQRAQGVRASRPGCPEKVGGVGQARVPPKVETAAGAKSVEAGRILDQVTAAQKRLDHILEMAQHGKSFTPAELIAMQAHVYRASQELDLAGKVVEKATGGVKQILQTQV